MTEKYKPISISYDFKGNHIRNFAIESLENAPQSPKTGYIYHDSVKDMLRYYDGTKWVSVPYIDGQYKLPMEFLNIIDSTGSLADADDDTLPTTLLLKESIEGFLPEDVIVTEWQNPVSDSNIPSEKLVKDTIDNVEETLHGEVEALGEEIGQEIDRLDGKIDDGLATKMDTDVLVTSWTSPLSDENIASEKLVKDTIDTKLDSSAVTQVLTSATDEVPSGLATTLALESKTDITMAIGTWKAGIIYREDSTVISSAKIFISLSDGNVGHDPMDDTDHVWWTEISGSGGGGGGSTVGTKTIQFGNSSDREYVLTHNLSTYDFVWSIRTNDESREYVLARVQAISRTSVKVILTNPPGMNALTINIVALKSSLSPTIVDPVSITEPSDTWTYQNDTDNPLFIQTYDTNGNQIYGDISQYSYQNFDPVITGFTAPKAGTLLVVKSPYIYQFNDTNTWIITHNLGRFVAVQCYSDTEGQITGDFVQNSNTAVVSFASNKSGYAVLVIPNLTIEFDSESSWTVQHGLNRIVAVQTFDESGDQMFGNIEQDGNSVTVEFTSNKSGFMLII